ncbi:U7 snRNA-associated Sm-like protein LSm11 [Microtus oregoni]|uniref:U7 snRNA-associated Sm-like protein LSm11 n=1 Tax=Microtus oregoni TaxID=111838 RepID=UPI001BB117FE|nr:U7 snRNA-associated Sm-like protein LSm11 [Microtus oregoni]XP_041490478.1 U7 snRNA-associated Sm-like protein LSm11 [Microtus oregoni]XP_041490485.1 U7 snRNA-associated Sm-like protein LSm11 [Microtus oregoni]
MSTPGRSFGHGLSVLLPPLPPAPPQLLRKSFAVSHDEREWERAGRAAAVGGRRCAQRGRGAAAASASRAGRAPGGRRRRRGLRAGDRVGAGRGQPEGGAGQPRRWLPRTQPGAATRAHPRPNRGRERSPRSAGSPARCKSPGKVGARGGTQEARKALCRGSLGNADIVFPLLEIGLGFVAVNCKNKEALRPAGSGLLSYTRDPGESSRVSDQLDTV